jgi:DDE superfamily endonuclease
MRAAGSTPPASPAATAAPGPLPPVRQEQIDPAEGAGIAWLCALLCTGRADLYGQDEADLALLPTLTCTWMRRGEQKKVAAPGTNEKRSVSVAADLGDGALLWRTDERRCAEQFGATIHACAARSAGRGRLAVLLVDNARSHQVGKTGIVRRALDRDRGCVVLVFLPAYSPDLQPAERVWRQWRPNVTHNHTRALIDELVGDSDAWLERLAADGPAVRRWFADLLTQDSLPLAA